jgi:hypothetical protein
MRARTVWLVMISTLGACALKQHDSVVRVTAPGADPALTPSIVSATSEAHGGVLISLNVPERSYVTVLRVSTQLSVAVLAVPGLSSSNASLLAPRGSHRLSLAEVPMYLNTNWRRARLVRNPSEGSLIATESPYPVNHYALAIVTAQPITFEDVQDALDDIDLRGDDRAVLARVAQAVGVCSGGAWSAGALRSAFLAPRF